MFLYNEDGSWYFSKEVHGASFVASCKSACNDPAEIKESWTGPGSDIEYITRVSQSDTSDLKRTPICLGISSKYSNLRGGYVRVDDHDGYPAYVSEAELEKGTPVYLWYDKGAVEWKFTRSAPGEGNTRFCFADSVATNPTMVSGWSDDDVTEVVEITWSIADPPGKEDRFQDKEFPAEMRSTGFLGFDTKVEWIYVNDLRRQEPSEVLMYPKFIFDKVEPNCLLQGAVGDCWLLAAIASLAEFPGHLESLFVSGNEISAHGKYEITLYDIARSEWRVLTIDGRIPCVPRTWWERDARPVFSRPYQNEARALLLEKAFAKLYGSYMTLSGGYMSLGWQAMTGCETQYMWDKEPTSGKWTRYFVKVSQQKEEIAKGRRDSCPYRRYTSDPAFTDAEMFQHLIECVEKNLALSAAIVVPETGELRSDGLVELHAYSILRCCEVNTTTDSFQMIQLRNPWGPSMEWNGAWSDESNEWEQHPELEGVLKPREASDGMFWMSGSDFFSRFTKMFDCPEPMKSKRSDFPADKKESKKKK